MHDVTCTGDVFARRMVKDPIQVTGLLEMIIRTLLTTNCFEYSTKRDISILESVVRMVLQIKWNDRQQGITAGLRRLHWLRYQ